MTSAAASDPADSDPRPVGTLAELWAEARDWGETSVHLKARLALANRAAVALGVAGAVLGTAAGSSLGWLPVSPRVLAVASALALALAAWVGRELLTPTRESDWVKARLLAEALKRAVWRGLMRVPPFDGDAEDAGGRLRTLAEELRRNWGLALLRRPAPDRSLPEARTLDDYLTLRVRDQIAWFERRVGEASTELTRAKRLTLGLGATAVVLGTLGVEWPALAAWVAVVTTASAAVVALAGTQRLAGVAPIYQATASRLGTLQAGWIDGRAARERLDPDALRARESLFVEECEQILASENESWRAETVEMYRSTRELVGELTAAAYAAPGPRGGDAGPGSTTSARTPRSQANAGDPGPEPDEGGGRTDEG